MTDYKSPLKEALCEFKKKEIKIFKESDNPFFKSKFADLATILDAIEAEAAKCGIVIYSQVGIEGENRLLRTTISHKDSDEEIISTFPVFGGKPQELGSSISYARRYNIQSLLNLTAEDDDGNAANKAAEKGKPKPTAQEDPNRTAGTKKTFITTYYNDIAACSDTDSLDILIVSNKESYEMVLSTYKEDVKEQIVSETDKRIAAKRNELN